MLVEHRGRVEVVEREVAVGDCVDRVRHLVGGRVDPERGARERARAERARSRGGSHRREPCPVAVEHLDPSEEVVPERHRLPALEVGVAGHQRVRLGLREREGDERERVDLLVRLRARVGDVQSQRRRDLVVAGATRVDLLTERPEEPLDRRMDVLVGLEDRGRVERDLGEAPLHLGELVRVQEPGAVQPAGVLRGRLAVVGQELGVLRAQELPHGRVE